MALLEEVSRADTLRPELLVRWQNELVDPRYAARGYRADQVYVADAAPVGRVGVVHYVAPKPEDVASFMTALFELDRLLVSWPPLVHAALLSFVFVFIHPFDDGNGRLHRLLLHNVLRRRGITGPGLVLPVSAVIVNDRRRYDDVLELVSKPVMEALRDRTELDADEVMKVDGDSRDLYRSFDATAHVEAVGAWAQAALENELVPELAWLRRFDETRSRVRAVVDMPDKRLNVFIRLVEQNKGTLSATKRPQFAELTDEEISQMENLVREHLVESELNPSRRGT